MAYKILLTSLYEKDKGSPVNYYFVREGSRLFFCDALTTVEASAKFVLARYEVDEILTITNLHLMKEMTEDRSNSEKASLFTPQTSASCLHTACSDTG